MFATLGIGTAVAATAKHFAEFERQTTLASFAAGGFAENIERIQKQARSLSRDFGQSSIEMAELVREAQQLGIATPEALDALTRASVKFEMAVGGDIEAVTSMTTVFRLLAAQTHGSREELEELLLSAERVSSAILIAGDDSAAGAAQLARFLGQLQAVGVSARFTTEEIIAMSGALANLDPAKASTFTTAMTRLFTKEFLDPRTERQFANYMGLSLAEFRRRRDQTPAGLLFGTGEDPESGFIDLLRREQNLGAVASKLGFSNTRDILLLNNLVANAELYESTLARVHEELYGSDETILSERTRILLLQLTATWNGFTAAIGRLADTIGAALAPILVPFLKILTGIVDVFADNRFLAAGLALTGIAFGIRAVSQAVRGLGGFAATLAGIVGFGRGPGGGFGAAGRAGRGGGGGGGFDFAGDMAFGYAAAASRGNPMLMLGAGQIAGSAIHRRSAFGSSLMWHRDPLGKRMPLLLPASIGIGPKNEYFDPNAFAEFEKARMKVLGGPSGAQKTAAAAVTGTAMADFMRSMNPSGLGSGNLMSGAYIPKSRLGAVQKAIGGASMDRVSLNHPNKFKAMMGRAERSAGFAGILPGLLPWSGLMAGKRGKAMMERQWARRNGFVLGPGGPQTFRPTLRGYARPGVIPLGMGAAGAMMHMPGGPLGFAGPGAYAGSAKYADRSMFDNAIDAAFVASGLGGFQRGNGKWGRTKRFAQNMRLRGMQFAGSPVGGPMTRAGGFMARRAGDAAFMLGFPFSFLSPGRRGQASRRMMTAGYRHVAGRIGGRLLQDTGVQHGRILAGMAMRQRFGQGAAKTFVGRQAVRGGGALGLIGRGAGAQLAGRMAGTAIGRGGLAAAGVASGPVGWVLTAASVLAPLFKRLGDYMQDLGERGGFLGGVFKRLAFVFKLVETVGNLINFAFRKLWEGIKWLVKGIENLPIVGDIIKGTNKGFDKLNEGLDKLNETLTGEKRDKTPPPLAQTSNYAIAVGNAEGVRNGIVQDATRLVASAPPASYRTPRTVVSR